MGIKYDNYTSEQAEKIQEQKHIAKEAIKRFYKNFKHAIQKSNVNAFSIKAGIPYQTLQSCLKEDTFRDIYLSNAYTIAKELGLSLDNMLESGIARPLNYDGNLDARTILKNLITVLNQTRLQINISANQKAVLSTTNPIINRFLCEFQETHDEDIANNILRAYSSNEVYKGVLVSSHDYHEYIKRDYIYRDYTDEDNFNIYEWNDIKNIREITFEIFIEYENNFETLEKIENEVLILWDGQNSKSQTDEFYCEFKEIVKSQKENILSKIAEG